MFKKVILSGLSGLLLFVGTVAIDSPPANANPISASAQKRHTSTMAFIVQAIQTYNVAESDTVNTFIEALVARDSAVSTALKAAWDPNSSAEYQDTAARLFPLVNGWSDAEVAATRAETTAYLWGVKRGAEDRAFDHAAAAAAYAYQVTLSASKSSKSAMAKSLALYKGKAKAKAKARDDQGNASYKSLQAAVDSYTAAATAAKSAMYWDGGLNYFFNTSSRVQAADTALSAFDANYTSAYNTYAASERANLSQLESAFTSIATSLPKLAKNAYDALTAAYVDAAK